MVDGQSCGDKAHFTLDEMICKGNKIAEMRKAELSHFTSLLLELAKRAEWHGFHPLTLSSPEAPGTRLASEPRVERREENSVADHAPITPLTPRHAQDACFVDPPLPNDIDFLNDIGISSFEFYSIVDQIANADMAYSILDSGSNGQET